MAFTKKQWEEWKKSNPDKWKERSEKIAAAHKGRSIRDTHKAAISASMKGRTLSDAHRKKISQAMKKVKSSKLNKNTINHNSFDKIRVTAFVLLALIIFAFVFGFTNLGFFVAPPSNFELYNNISVGSDADIISEHVIFGGYKPENCDDGVLVYRGNGSAINFYSTSEVYVDSTCSEVDVHFENDIYKSSDEFDVYYVNPTPRHGSIFNNGNFQIRIKTNKVSTFALLELNDSTTILNSPMAGSMNEWSYSLSNLADGNYYIRVFAQDQDANLITTEQIMITVDSSAEAQEFYFTDVGDEKENYYVYYQIAPGQEIISDISQPTFEVESSKKQVRPPQFNIPEIIPDEVPAEPAVESILLSSDEPVYDTDIKQVFYDFDYPLQAETTYTAKFKGQSGNKRDLRFELNNTYYEFDFDSIYYRVDGNEIKSFKLNQDKGVSFNKNKLTYSNLGHGIKVEYEIGDNSLFENITIPQLNFLDVGSTGDVVIEGIIDIPVNQDILLYADGPAGNTTILYTDGTELDVSIADGVIVEEAEGYASGIMIEIQPEIAESRHKLENTKYTIIEPNGNTHGKEFKKLITEGDIDFVDENNKTLFFLPRPKIFDADGNIIFTKYELEKINGELKLRIIIPAEWLSTAQYPIVADPETVAYTYGASYTARLYTGHKNLWRDNRGKWFIFSVDGNAWPYRGVLTTDATGSWVTTTLCGNSSAVITGLGAGLTGCHQMSSYMEKHDNTYHVVIGAWDGSDYQMVHSQCVLENSSSHTLTNCWTATNGTVGYDAVSASGYSANLPDMTIDRDGNMYILYRIESRAPATANKYDLEVRKYNESSGWETAKMLFNYTSGTDGGATWNTIDSSAEGNVHIVYIDSKNTGVTDNTCYHTVSRNGGATWTGQAGGSNDTLTTTCLGPSMSITSDDKIILVTQEGSNDIYRRIWNETGTSVPGRTLLTSTYSNPPRVGSAANGGAVIFFSERTGTYRQMISKLTKESLTPATPSVYASPSPARAGDFCSVERKGTIFSTTNNIGLARYTAVSNNSLFHITETVYDSGSSAVYGDQKYQVLPLTGTDIQAVQSSDYSDNHAILRDSEGYYYVLMLSDWNTTYATDGGVLYMSRSLTTDVDTNGIIYFDNPKPIIGTNLSDATIQIVLTPPMFITDFSAWMDPDTDHLHIAFAGFKNYTTAAPANGPYNNIYYAELENLVNYSTLSSWNSYYFFGTYYYVTIAGPPGGIPITTVSYNYDPAIIGDYDGNVYIAYQNDTRGSTDENQTLHVRKRAAGAGLDGWGTATDIETDYGWTKDVSLDVDSKNRIYVAYSHKLQTGLSNYARLRRSSDSAATWRNLSGAVGYEAPISRGALTSFINGPDVAVTPDDRVFLVANQRVALSVYDLNTITWVNSSETSWATNINLADTVYHYYPSIGAGSAGEVIFLWSRKAGGYHNDTSWRGNSYSAPGTWSSAVAVYDHESDTYSGGPSVLSEYRSRQDSDIFGYMATKGSSYGGWYFGILDTGNFTTTDRCLNLATPGTYTLTENLTGKQYNNDYCIRILVDNITLDCDNYAIDGSGTSGTYGIFMTGKSNVVIKDCIVEDYDWDFVSMGTSTNNTVQNLTTNGTNVNFTYGGNVFVRGAVSPGTDAPGQMNISHFLNITNNTTAWMYLNVSYDASDIPVDISNNTTIKIWKNSSGTWSDSIGTPNAIDETNKRVYANITNFSSIFAPMGELSCVDTDGDGFGTGDTAGCTYSEVDCDDSDDEIHPLPNGTSYTLNHSVTVCTETYVNTHVTINTDDVILNCNNSVLDGNDDTGTGILLSGTINNSEVWNCTIFDYFDGIKIYSQVTYPTFRNNNLSFNGNDGIYLTTAEHSLIINNTVNSNSQNGINLAECQNDTIINNTANSNTQAGIILSAQSNFSVVENNTANSNSYGIYLTQCLYSNVTDNTANSNSIAGIYLSSASIEARITNNIANSNDYWGIGIESDDNIITDNIATLNTDIGIYLSGADNNTITDNNASFNPNWDFLSETTSNDNTIVNLITDDTNSSFTYSGNLQLTSATSPATDPVGYSNISKYINVTNSGTAWMLLNVTYNQTYVETDLELDESSLIMYKHNGSWYDASAFANVYGVDTTNDYVYANISDFSIFSLMGPSISCHITTELTLSENLICTSGFNITDTGILHTAGFNVTVTGGNTNITGDLDFVGGYGNFTNTVTTYSGSNWTSSSSAVINVTNYTHSAGTMNMGNADFHVYGTWDTAGGLDAQTSTTYMYTGAVIQSDASGQNTGAYHLIVPAGEVVNKTGSGTYFSIDGILEINGTVQYVSGDRRFAIWGLGTGEMIMGPSADVSTMDLASVLTNNITESTWGRLSITDGATTTLLGDLTLTRDASLQVYHWGTSFSTFNLNGYTVNMTGSNDVFYAGSGSSQGRVLLNGGTITGAAVVDVYTDGSYIVDSGSGKIDTTDIEIRRGYINASSTTNITATGNVTINDTFRGSSSTDLTFGWLDVTANGNLSCTDCVIEIDSEDSGTGYALLTAGYTTGNVSLNFTHNGVTEVDLYSNAGGNFKNIYVDNSGITAEFNSATITGSFVTVNGIARPNVAADTLTIGDDLNISSGTTFG
ncbi:MAG: hypothetical protein GOV02_01040, partial [Candidatus Aenigmarchaeota archaeon]|nr:hypothetical protein [Candidatus Aenigmarchaeota archaeon]